MMTRRRIGGERVRLRTSRAILVLALALTVTVAVVGQVAMIALYRYGVAQSEPRVQKRETRQDALVVGVGRTPGGPGEWINYASAMAHLQAELGRPVTVRYFQSRSESSELIAAKQVDVAFVSTYRYLELKSRGAATLVAAPVLETQVKDAAVMVVAADGPFDSVESLRGKVIALASPESLGGHAYLYWLFDQRKQDPNKHFGSIVEGDTQDQNLGRVLKGSAAAAVVNRSALATWPPDSFRVVSQSPEYGMPPLVAREGLSERDTAEIRETLRYYRPDSEHDGGALQGFTIPRDTDYEFARVLQRRSAGRLLSEVATLPTEGQ